MNYHNSKRRKPAKGAPDLGAGVRVGPYRLARELGSGGNGVVWLCHDLNGGEVALKFLTRLNKRRVARFNNEVRVLRGISKTPGVVPMIDSGARAARSKPSEMWYAMPVCRPGKTEISKNLQLSTDACLQVAATLAGLHQRGIYHRDIKPENILLLQGRWCISDFGLVKVDGSMSLTLDNESVGARWTIAPEMRRQARAASGGPADVYSLAKTLWILLSDSATGFDGQFSRGSPLHSLRRSFPGESLGALEDLLEDATQDFPGARPTMRDFEHRLREFTSSLDNFELESRLEWRSLQRELLPAISAHRTIWTSRTDIISVLNQIGRQSNVNHALCPNGGGNDLMGTKLSAVRDCIELYLGSHDVPSIVRPQFLELVFFSGEPEWSYFWLETSELEPSGVYTTPHAVEEYVELPNGNLIERAYWDEGVYPGANGMEPLPRRTRLVVRYCRGPFVIVSKTSPYNRIPGTYDGRHARMTNDEFRSYMNRGREAILQARQQDPKQS